MYSRKWKPSKAKIKEFASKMNEIDQFCQENAIQQSKTSDSYYFTLNGKKYRISNHTMKTSNNKAFNQFGEQVREQYHNIEKESDTICITASKTRLIEIYTALKSGKVLDKRGYAK